MDGYMHVGCFELAVEVLCRNSISAASVAVYVVGQTDIGQQGNIANVYIGGTAAGFAV